MKDKIKLRDLCREVGVSHLEVVEVLRRVRDNVIDDDAEVITQTVGTFYASKHKARTRTLNGIVYSVPEKVVVALRGPRFPGRSDRLVLRPFELSAVLLVGSVSEEIESAIPDRTVFEFRRDFTSDPLAGQLVIRFIVYQALEIGPVPDGVDHFDEFEIRIEKIGLLNPGPITLKYFEGDVIDRGETMVSTGRIRTDERIYLQFEVWPGARLLEVGAGRLPPFVVDSEQLTV